MAATETQHTQHHKAVVLFYKYFLPDDPSCSGLISQDPEKFTHQLRTHQSNLCHRLKLKGRVLLSDEGINGTVSAESDKVLDEYIKAMEGYDARRDFGVSYKDKPTFLYSNIDWKTSHVDNTMHEPFPDLKISIVKEIVSSGGAVCVDEISTYGGNHLSPRQFHEMLLKGDSDTVLIDVRNTFEHDIGHFVYPTTQRAAINPSMATFSAFDTTFCAKEAPSFQNKKVLIYCTGGIRCEKASVMLRKRGVEDVNQLKGGIHRYLEEYGDAESFFRGKNFVFDQRVALAPTVVPTENCVLQEAVVVGKCLECSGPYDELDGSRLCTVCRDLVLVCAECRKNLREYHCHRHSPWKLCYFTFLEVYDKDELEDQRQRLMRFREKALGPEKKNTRNTLSKQINKVTSRIEKLKSKQTEVNRLAPRRCRTCELPKTECDGNCWGFWKDKGVKEKEVKRKKMGD